MIRERLTGQGLTQRRCLPVHPYQSAYRSLFLKPVQIGFHFVMRQVFGTTAEVHPAEFIQLRLPDGLFRAPGCSAFPAGRGSALPVRPGAVSAGRSACREMSFISLYFTGLILSTRDKEIYSLVREVEQPLRLSPVIPSSSIASCACVRNTLPCARADDQAKRPRSSRLVRRHSPSPVDHSSLT